MVLPRVLALSCKPMKVLSIRATQNNLSEAGKAIPFGMKWISYFIGSIYIERDFNENPDC
ncbi:hypothetical protein B0G52_1444 [Cohnella sp. SGD-V74]|nr:hypothetical protein B0G52_1444 [Cohnella sp. SGD-V74]